MEAFRRRLFQKKSRNKKPEFSPGAAAVGIGGSFFALFVRPMKKSLQNTPTCGIIEQAGISCILTPGKVNTMKYKHILCMALCLCTMLAAGCSRETTDPMDSQHFEEIHADLGQAAEYGDMTLTVLSAEDPGIKMSDGKAALFFQVRIENNSKQTVDANYLNNFSLTVDGVHYLSGDCCTIPVMKELYDFYDQKALAEELSPGESCTGYIACEADMDFSTLELHYTPKTTDRVSRITVKITKDLIQKVSK